MSSPTQADLSPILISARHVSIASSRVLWLGYFPRTHLGFLPGDMPSHMNRSHELFHLMGNQDETMKEGGGGVGGFLGPEKFSPLATTVAAAPAERASWAPFPGFISTPCTVCPMGIENSGSVLPGLTAAAGPLSITSPAATLAGAMLYPKLGACPSWPPAP